MTSFASITLEVSDPAAADAFYKAFGLDPYVNVRAPDGTICEIASSKKKDTEPFTDPDGFAWRAASA